MSAVAYSNDRVTDLLADQALEGLTPEQELELESLLASEGVIRDISFSVAAAALELSMLTPRDLQPCPAQVRARLERAGQQWAQATASVMRAPEITQQPFPEVSRRATRFVFRAGPWLAAAACLTLAAVAWWPNPPEQDLMQVVNADPTSTAMTFGEWDNPEVRGVRGECVWCERSQMGYLRFVNLPPNDPTKEQYQLWIIDERGMGQRISGGIFDAAEDGETVVPIKPGIRVRDAKAFAVTIEAPGGTWVSDMSRRVVIASR
jgi:hypothetical protein